MECGRNWRGWKRSTEDLVQMLLPEFNRTYQDIKNIDLTLMDLLVDIIAVGCLWGCFQEPLKSGCVALWHCGRSTADVNTSFATKEVTMY